MTRAPPTVLQIIPNLETGGAELSCIEIADALTRAGARALVLSEGGRMVESLVAVGAKHISFPAATKNPLRIYANAGEIAALIRNEGVDLIHARSRAPAWSAYLAARQCKIPFVTTYHGAYKETSKFKNFYNSVMVRSDAVIANSHYTADLIRARYGTPDNKISVIYRGVDLETFDRNAVSADRVSGLRASWGVLPTQRIVLHAARLTAWKGQSQMIDLAARIKNKLPDVVFILAGSDQGRTGYRAQLEHQIAALKVQETVKLVGHVDDIPAACVAAALVFVASNEPEAFGRAAAEAQAIGCPVVSTNIGAPPETILSPPRVTAAQRTGWLVKPFDLDAYEASLTEALTMEKTDYAALCARASRHARTAFTKTAMQRQTLAVYDGLLGARLAQDFSSAGPLV